MKFSDLPLNVPVLRNDQSDFIVSETIRLNDDEYMVRGMHEDDGRERNWILYPKEMVNWNLFSIIDQPTDEDAAEIGINTSPVYKIGQGRLWTQEYGPEFTLIPKQETEHRLHQCTCSLYGAMGLLAIGCQCGGK